MGSDEDQVNHQSTSDISILDSSWQALICTVRALSAHFRILSWIHPVYHSSEQAVQYDDFDMQFQPRDPPMFFWEIYRGPGVLGRADL